LLLTHTGAENDVYEFGSLLQNAVYHRDKEMLTILFDNNVNPNQTNVALRHPIFFTIETIDIAQMFINKGVNLRAKGNKTTPHILWACFTYGHSVELIEFYLRHNLDTRCIKTSILHSLVQFVISKYDIDRYVQIGTLLLKADPGMINMLDENNKTPLDGVKITMQQFDQNIKKDKKGYDICQALITLFEQHGGKTAEQLKENAAQQNKIIQQAMASNKCCICYDLCGSSDKKDQLPALKKIWHT
jgi:hypothetical protein